MKYTNLTSALRTIIADRIHKTKCSIGSPNDKAGLTSEQWKAIGSNEIADEVMVEITEMLELWLYIPCCHTTGMHDPNHFEARLVCESQLAEAFKRFCKDLGANPVTRSKPECCWCRDYLHYRKGEGVPLFPDKKD